MNCHDVRDDLSAYLDGELGESAARTREAIEAHLRDCPACALELATLRRTIDLVRSLRKGPVSIDLRREIRAAIAAGEVAEEAPTGRVLSFRRGWATLAVAAAAAILLLARLQVEVDPTPARTGDGGVARVEPAPEPQPEGTPSANPNHGLSAVDFFEKGYRGGESRDGAAAGDVEPDRAAYAGRFGQEIEELDRLKASFSKEDEEGRLALLEQKAAPMRPGRDKAVQEDLLRKDANDEFREAEKFQAGQQAGADPEAPPSGGSFALGDDGRRGQSRDGGAWRQVEDAKEPEPSRPGAAHDPRESRQESDEEVDGADVRARRLGTVEPESERKADAEESKKREELAAKETTGGEGFMGPAEGGGASGKGGDRGLDSPALRNQAVEVPSSALPELRVRLRSRVPREAFERVFARLVGKSFRSDSTDTARWTVTLDLPREEAERFVASLRDEFGPGLVGEDAPADAARDEREPTIRVVLELVGSQE